jgi:septal ring factor EnvC (AmiA/AmiB activator)
MRSIVIPAAKRFKHRLEPDPQSVNTLRRLAAELREVNEELKPLQDAVSMIRAEMAEVTATLPEQRARIDQVGHFVITQESERIGWDTAGLIALIASLKSTAEPELVELAEEIESYKKVTPVAGGFRFTPERSED